MSKNSKKRQCLFTDDLRHEFPFLKKTKVTGNVFCDTCSSEFSMGSGGKTDIKRHITTEKHKRALEAVATSSKLSDFFRKADFGAKEQQLAHAEIVFTYHTVMHSQSFRSMDCTSKLVRSHFEPKFTCGRTKTEAIAKNVLAPYSIDQILSNMEYINFLTIFSDASNHKDTKLFPSVIRYFDYKRGIQVKLLDFVSLPGETSDIIATSIYEILCKYNMQNKVAAICADNANTNFGGLLRKGTNNVYSKLKDQLQKPIIGVGCAAHIVNNAIQAAADQLPVDIEGIIIKIYSHFYIFTVRVEKLKDFCEEAEVEYMQILGYSKTRWLALMPAIERVLKMFSPLKSYFLSIDNSPRILRNFFEDESSEMWLFFMHSQAAVFHSTVKKIESDNSTITEVVSEIDDLMFKLRERVNNQFLPLNVRSQLKILEESGWSKSKSFKSSAMNFYQKCIDYLEVRVTQFDHVDCFKWVNLKNTVDWQAVQTSFEYILKFKNSDELVDADKEEAELFDEVSYARKYANEEKIASWVDNNTKIEDRWVELFKHFEGNNIPFRNLKKIVEFALCLPGTNAVTERVFSVVNKNWTTEKSQLSVDTLKAILQVRFNFQDTCEEFSKNVSSNISLLRKAHGAEKYV